MLAWGGPRPDALSQDALLFARFDYAYPLVGVEVEVGLPSTERTLQGPGGCRAFLWAWPCVRGVRHVLAGV